MTSIYDKDFYDRISAPSLRSARKIAPFVVEVFKPKSVVDFGCGTGTWLKAFEEQPGVENILGLEYGDIEQSDVLIDPGDIVKADLSQAHRLNRRYDLAISLEVAEHLPETAAETFVSNLVAASDIVLFSAAAPNQAGRNHINLKLPSYWANIFALQGYAVCDLIRPKFWRDQDIEVWYRQNCLVFAPLKKLEETGALALQTSLFSAGVMDVIHPEMSEKIASDFKDRISSLHETYKERIRTAREEAWEKARRLRRED